jgi:MFS family permease
MYDLTSSVWALVLFGVIGIAAATALILYRGAVAARLGRRTAMATAAAAAAVLGGWIAASWLLARAGVYHRDSGEAAPWFGLAFAATLIALLLATQIPVVSRILGHAGTPTRLALPHTLRVVGVSFLIAMAQGDLPAVFALPAGLGDIAIGVSAPLVAQRLERKRDLKGAVRFNVLGILDLVVALSIGFLAGLGPFRPLDVTPSTEPLALLPLALVPTVAVPLAIALHIMSLRRLHAAAHTSRTGADASSQPQMIRRVPRVAGEQTGNASASR